ncbi:MAG: Ig-like domain-containing protein [Bacteroidales bacterium]
MKNLYLNLTCFFIALFSFLSCSSDSSEPKEGLKSLSFKTSKKDIDQGADESLELSFTMWGGSAQKYDNEKNSLSLKWSSSDEKVATVSEKGLLQAIEVGKTTIKVSNPEGTIAAEMVVNVVSNEYLAVLDKSFDDGIIYSKGVQLVRNSVIQSIDVDSKGLLYYAQIAGTDLHNIHVIRGAANASKPADYMTFSYFGHGTNMAIEEDGADKYVWIASYGTRGSDNNYGGSQTVVRVKYESGRSYFPADAIDQYYLPGVRNIHPAVNTEANLLAVTSSGGSESGRMFRVYNLKEAKESAMTSMKLASSVTSGGGTSGAPSVTETPTVKVHDLSKLNKLGEFRVMEGNASSEVTGHYPFQGFEVGDNRIYFYEGEGNNNDGMKSSVAYVTVFDFKGQVVRKRSKVLPISDMQALSKHGITTTGYMEAEGIKVHGGKMYLGFASKSTDDVRRAVVLKYDLE